MGMGMHVQAVDTRLLSLHLMRPVNEAIKISCNSLRAMELRCHKSSTNAGSDCLVLFAVPGLVHK